MTWTRLVGLLIVSPPPRTVIVVLIFVVVIVVSFSPVPVSVSVATSRVVTGFAMFRFGDVVRVNVGLSTS